MFPQLPDAIGQVLNTIKQAGGQGYVVGGALRDALMGNTPGDWDVAATLPQQELQRLFPAAVNIGGQYGTLRVMLEGLHCDITPCRSEADYQDHRHPARVVFNPNILVDLTRRDFTVNAMAYDGQMLLDPFGGQVDLQSRVLRCVGDAAQRFEEDHLRILRLFRFSATLGFTAEWNTFTAARDMAAQLGHLHHERVLDEMQLILLSDGPQVLGPLISCGGLRAFGFAFSPSLAPMAGVPRNTLCRWWALMLLCESDVAQVADAFCFSRLLRARLQECSRLYRLGPARTRVQMKQKLRRCQLDYALLADTFAAVSPRFCDEAQLYRELQDSCEPYRLQDLAVDGDMLYYEDIRGKRCGRVLDELLSAVIENPQLNDTAVLLGMARGLQQIL